MTRVRSYTASKTQNWILPALYLSLVAIGVLTVYSSMIDRDALLNQERLPPGFVTYIIQIGIGVLLFFFMSLIQPKFWHIIHFPMYGISLILLVLVLIVGHEVHGAKSWFLLPGGVSFQVSEMAKAALALSMSAYLAHYKTDLSSLRSQMVASAIILAPVALILMQPDAGTGIVFLSVFFVLYIGGFPPTLFLFFFGSLFLFIISQVWSVVGAFLTLTFITNLTWLDWKIKSTTQLITSIALVLGTLLLLIFSGAEEALMFNGFALLFFISRSILQKQYTNVLRTVGILLVMSTVLYASSYAVNEILRPHQKERIDVWLNPERCNPQGSMYNLLQSKMAISSGRFGGKGFLQGTMTRLDYVPEQSTDFIFSVIGEEQGFLGTASVVILFGLLLFRLLAIAGKLRSRFNKFFVIIVSTYLFVHVLVNIGMTMGLMPVVGIPLPLISKGGTAFISFSVMLGIAHSFQYVRDA